MNSVWAFMWNVGTCFVMRREPFKAEIRYKNVSTNVQDRGGTARSSDEPSVMEVEPRGSPVQE